MFKEDHMFQWDRDVQGKSFAKVQDHLLQAPVLRYFDPKLQLELQSDASQQGLGACVMQAGQPLLMHPGH
jgi:hypothetical protein